MSGTPADADFTAVAAGGAHSVALRTDVDVDGSVGFGDLLSVLSYWGPCPE